MSAALALIVALSEAAGIGLIFPLLLAVADPERLQASAGLQRIYNLLGARSAEDFVTRAGGLIVSLLILKNLFALAIVRWQVSFLSQQECALSVSLFRRYLTMPYEAFSRRNSPELIQMAAGETSTAISAFMLPAVSLLVELAVIAGIVAVVVVIDPSAAIAILATIVCAAAAFNASMRMWLRRLGERLIFSNTEVLRRLQEGIGAAKEIRVLGRSAAIEAEFLKSRRKLANLRATHTFFGSLPRAYLEIVLLLSLVAVAWFTMRDRPIAETVSVLAIFGAAGLRLLPSVNRVLVLLQQMNVAGPSVDQLYRELSGAGSNAPAPTGPPLAVGIGEALPDRDPPTRQRGLVISGVHYRYVDRPTPALSGVSLQVPWGRSIGLVGVSGAGKSTLVDIILGLRQPQRGSVLVDGREICSNIDAWQRRIGYVPQQIFLIDASIRRNIALGIPDDGIDERRIHEVMQIASIDELVAGLPDGLDTIVGEEGASLSGGQRQRIGIARALYHDPDVLLLDEATSALDNATESKITEMLGRLAGIKTMIVVAHRLSTIRRCDSIAVLKDGVCVGQGPYDELACTNLDFADLIRAGSR